MATRRKATPPEPPRRLRVRFMDKVKPRNVEWFWEGWLPRGKLCLFTGDGGAGKSTILFDLAARVTTGAPFPDEEDDEAREPGTALYIGVEDGIEDTVVPRLIAAEADMGRVGAVHFPVDENGASPQFTIPGDVPALRRLIERHEAELCIIDPITAFLDDKVDPYKDSSVRRALSPLAQVAEDTDCTIVMILHFNKKVGQKAQHRGTGSPAFTNLSRAVMSALPDPENIGLSVLASVKSNNAVRPKSLAYEIVECTFREGRGRKVIATSKIAWLGESGVTADQAAGAEGHGVQRAAPLRDACQEMLRDLLSDGPRVGGEVQAELKEHGEFSKGTIHAACKAIGVKKKPVYKNGKIQHWEWLLEGS